MGQDFDLIDFMNNGMYVHKVLGKDKKGNRMHTEVLLLRRSVTLLFAGDIYL